MIKNKLFISLLCQISTSVTPILVRMMGHVKMAKRHLLVTVYRDTRETRVIKVSYLYTRETPLIKIISDINVQMSAGDTCGGYLCSNVILDINE